MSQVTTHVLDTALGVPAAGIRVLLERRDGDGWTEVGRGVTDADGRVAALCPDRVEDGVLRLTFATGEHLDAAGRPGYYPEVQVQFRVAGADHHHVPLLLSPFGYSTYRGS